MRLVILGIAALFIFGILNYSIFEKEQTIKNGELVYLELAPRDPRSLLQGDYMRLGYAIERELSRSTGQFPKRGFLVITVDEEKVGHFSRVYAGEDLKSNEKRFKFTANNRWGRAGISLRPNSFFFQEGHGKHYQNAKYGVFRYDHRGKSLLVGLADQDLQVIRP